MAKQDNLISSDSPFDATQRATLALVLDLIVPASADGRFPSAADVGVPAYLANEAPDAVAPLCSELDELDACAQRESGAAFAALAAVDRQALVDALRAADPRFMRRLAIETVTCYYQDDRVMTAIGLEPRPPFPKGYQVVSGDLSLLDPVRRRGQVWREVP